MFRKIAKFAVYLILIVIIVMSSLGIWLATGTRTVPFLKNYLEESIASIMPGYQLSVGGHFIKYNRDTKTFIVSGKNIVIKQNDDLRAKLNDIAIEFDIGNVLTLKFAPKLIAINDYRLNIDVKAENESSHEETLDTVSEQKQRLQKQNIALAVIDNQEIYNALHNIIDTLGASQKYDVSFKRFALSRGKIALISGNKPSQTIQLSTVTGNVVSRENGGIVLVTDVVAQIGDQSLSFSNEIFLGDDDIINAKIHFEDMSFSTLAKQIPQEVMGMLEGIGKSNFSASGIITFFLSQNEGIEHIQVSLSSKGGVVFLDKLFDQGIRFDNLSIQCSISDNLVKYNCHDFNVDIIDNKIYGNFDIEIFASEIFSNLLLKIDNLEVNSLAPLWPKIAARKARKWINVNIADGTINHAVAKFKLKNNYRTPDRKTVPVETDIKINLESSTVKYHKDYDPIYDIDADVHINNNDINVHVMSARHRESTISNALVEVKNYRNIKELSLGIRGGFEGNINDFTEIIKAYSQVPIKVLEKELTDVHGTVLGTFDVLIPLQKERINQIQYKIEGQASNVKVDDILKDISVSNANVDVMIDNSAIKIEGSINIADIMGHITVHQQLDNASDNENTYFFRSEMNAAHLKTLGIGEIPFIKGNFMVGVSITLKGDVSRILIKSDFSNADITIPKLGFNKPPDTPFAIDINSYLLPDNVVDIRNLYVRADDLDVQGRAVIDRKYFILRELVLDKAVSKNNDFQLYYSMLKDEMNIVVKAEKIDLSNVNYQLSTDGVGGGKHKSIEISSDIIQFTNDTFLSNVRGSFKCNPKHCERMEFNANINNKERLTLSLKPDTESPKILSRFLLESDNIGGILKALNFSNNINGGYLRIDANSLISEESGNRIMQGEAILRDFTVIQTPILARLLTLASLNGVVDLLNGGGLKFKRFNIPFIVENDILTIRNGSGHGNSIGLTVEGNIDTKKDSLNLAGTVIPAYMVNKVIGEIPIVGGILTGGKDQGVVAVKYDIKGLVSNPDITVNPLSILTPGFLRGVFDVMTPSEPSSSDQTDSKTAITKE